MQQPKPITITGQLVPGRDDRAIEFVGQPHVNTSEVIRLGIDLFIDYLNHQDSLADISADILAGINRIEKALQEGGTRPLPEKEKPKSDNLFFNASP